MSHDVVVICYLLMVWLQVLHILEEIACGAYKVAGHGLGRYLKVASVLVTVNLAVFALILWQQPVGYVLGLVTSGVLAAGNGLVHVAGFVRTRSYRDGLGAGVFTGIPLGIVGLVVFVMLAGHLLTGGVPRSAGPQADLAASLTGPDAAGDRLDVHAEGEVTILDIYSPRGIGSAEISATDGRWPAQVVVRLHLSGLESFEADNGEFTIRTGVSSATPQIQHCELIPAEDGPGQVVPRDSDYWISLSIVPAVEPGGDASPAGGGTYELTLPPVLFEAEPETLIIRWVDFFRG